MCHPDLYKACTCAHVCVPVWKYHKGQEEYRACYGVMSGLISQSRQRLITQMLLGEGEGWWKCHMVSTHFYFSFISAALSSPGMWRTFDKGTSIPPETSNHPPTVPWRLHFSSQKRACHPPIPPKALRAEWIEIPVDMNCKYYKKNNVLVHAVLTETICAHVYTDWKRVTRITRRLSTGCVWKQKKQRNNFNARPFNKNVCCSSTFLVAAFTNGCWA